MSDFESKISSAVREAVKQVYDIDADVIPTMMARQLSWLEQSVHTRQVVSSSLTLATITI